MLEQLLERVLGDLAGRDHQPDARGALELLRSSASELGGARRDVRVVRLHVVPGSPQALGHVRAHAAEADHSELHQMSSSLTRTIAPAALLRATR